MSTALDVPAETRQQEETARTHDEMATYTLAAAKADAIRQRAEADAEAERIKAEGEAEAARIKAAEEARKQQLANERQALKLQQDQAAHREREEERARKREDEAKARREQQQQEAADQKQQQDAAERRKKAVRRWKLAALTFAIVCAVISLPFQVMAFAGIFWFLAIVPLALEGAAWVMLSGAAAAIEEGRPAWHYRLAALLLSFFAAAVNWHHGNSEYNAIAGAAAAFTSIAGPVVWDFHEHGRIARKSGKPTRAQRRQDKREEKRAAKQKATEEAAAAAKTAADAEAAKEAAATLAQHRAEHFGDVWKHAEKLAAALGETTVSEQTWRRAHLDIKGAEPGEDVETLRARNKAAKQVAAAKSESPGEKPVKITSRQLNPQMPPSGKKGSGRGATGGPPVRGVRRKGDTTPYSTGARKAASATARKAQKEAA